MRIGLLIACVFAGVSGAASAGEFLRTTGTIGPAGEYLVVFDDEEDAIAEMAVAEFAITKGFEVRRVWRNALHGAWIAGVQESDAIDLSRQAGIASVSETQMARPATSRVADLGLDRLDQPTLPLDGFYNYMLSGAGVNAYILDTGAKLTHTDFAPVGRTTLDYNSTGDGYTGDDDGHGTAVASIVGGLNYGVASHVRLRIIRACSHQVGFSCSDAQFIDGLDWVAAHGIRPGVVNISYNFAVTPALNLAVQKVVGKGFLVFNSAGNDPVDACTSTPTGAFVVSGTNTNDGYAGVGYGPCVDVFAWTAVRAASRTTNTSSFVFCCTSASAPLAAGLGTLFLTLYPSMLPSALATSIISMANAGVTSVPPATTNLMLYEDVSVLHP